MREVLDVRWDIARGLYGLINTLQPGSEAADVAEHALDLVIEPRQNMKDPHYILRDVLRNARFIVRRTHSRQRTLLERLAQHDGRALARKNAAMDAATVVAARELEEEIRTAVERLGPRAVRCLEGLLAGESVGETARATDSALRTVDRTRQRVRAVSRVALLTREPSAS